MLSSDDIQRIDIVRMAFGKRIEIGWCSTIYHVNSKSL
jgi:hypothetical protein